MRRLLMLTFFVGLIALVGCKDEKVIPPKDVPKAPDGPPTGAKPAGETPAKKAGTVSP